MWQDCVAEFNAMTGIATAPARFDAGAMTDTLTQLADRIAACRICADRFAATETAHEPRPVVRPSATARLLIAGQAPGARVHKSGIPFDDPSGDRLRDLDGRGPRYLLRSISRRNRPHGLLLSGLRLRVGSDLPPPRVCAATWREDLIAAMPQVELTLLVGQYAQGWHIRAERKASLTQTVRSWQEYGPRILPLPHPSWRNTGWLRRNPWFGREVLPWLRAEVARLVSPS